MKLTGRVAILFGIFTLLFGALGMRLWFVQVAEGAEAAQITEGQSWVYLPTPAPRGDIRDRNGDLVASSRYVPAVVVDRHLVDREQRADLVQALSTRLAIPAADIDAMFEEAGVNGIFTVATVDTVEAYQINEQLRSFPGVRIEKVPERVYITGESMAHVVGQLGLPTAEEVAANPDLDPNMRIGKSGVERTYDDLLQGTSGEIAYQVRSGEVIAQRQTTPATSRQHRLPHTRRPAPTGRRECSRRWDRPLELMETGDAGGGQQQRGEERDAAGRRRSCSTPARAPSGRWPRIRASTRRSSSPGSTRRPMPSSTPVRLSSTSPSRASIRPPRRSRP